MRPIQAARQTSSRAASISMLHVGQGERDGLVLDDRPAELDPVLGVVEGVLVGGAGDADGLRADGRAGQLEGAHGGLAAEAAARRGPGPGARRAAPCRRAGSGPGRGRRRGRRRRCARRAGRASQLAGASEAPALPGGTTNAACPREPELGVDGGGDDVHVGDPAVGRVRLLPVEHPLVGGLVVAGAGAHRRRRPSRPPARWSRTRRPWARRRRRSTAAPTPRSARGCRSRRWRRRRARCRRSPCRCRRRPRRAPRWRSGGRGRWGRPSRWRGTRSRRGRSSPPPG